MSGLTINTQADRDDGNNESNTLGSIAKHRDFPEPVDKLTNTSLPPTNFSITSYCLSFTFLYPISAATLVIFSHTDCTVEAAIIDDALIYFNSIHQLTAIWLALPGFWRFYIGSHQNFLRSLPFSPCPPTTPPYLQLLCICNSWKVWHTRLVSLYDKIYLPISIG